MRALYAVLKSIEWIAADGTWIYPIGRICEKRLEEGCFFAYRAAHYEQKTHEECASLMDVSRTTVTEIYQSARAKIADALVNGKKLVISGGEYRLCGGEISSCLGICRRAAFSSDENKSKKGDNIMKVAVTYDN